DGRAPLRLAAVEAGRRPVDEAELLQFAEPLPDLREQRAGRDRADDRRRRPPAELLRDLVRDRLRPFRVVRAKPDVDERPGQLERELDGEPAAVVVAAADG